MDIFNKAVWNKKDYDIFVCNIKLLANKKKLKIRDIEKIIGKKNITRRDQKRPSEKLIKTICNYFKKDKEWFSVDRRYQGAPKLKSYEMPDESARKVVEYNETYLDQDELNILLKYCERIKKPPGEYRKRTI